MNIILKAGRWGISIVLLFVAGWAAFLGYMVQGWVTQFPSVMDSLPNSASLATNAIAGNWWVLWLFAVLTFACAIFLVWKREVPVAFAAFAACALLISANVFNAVVMSAGFEMTAIAGQ